MRERIADPIGWRDKQAKLKKQQDWYYNFKQEEKQQDHEEEVYLRSLNPVSLFIYTQIYSRCCKSKRKSKYNFEAKKNN